MRWIRFAHEGTEGFGVLEGRKILVFHGDMFGGCEPSGQALPLDRVRLLTPCAPSKMICLWNNFHALAAKLELAEPAEPLFFLKAPNAFLAHGQTIRRPRSYDGPVVYEGELGIVIGKTCAEISESAAAEHIFGYTCVNDVTAAKIIPKDPTFAQWARAKSFDTFGVFGPAIQTDMDPLAARHDAGPRRRHRLRHLAGRRLDEGADQPRRGHHRRHRHPGQRLRSVRRRAARH
jgi:2-keto-4-pentenoate hydratase/2-oxohepta-3-ene-1,7-dioic acid hydratase in catechol pathway